MQRRFFLMGGVLALAACGGRLNPFNWFRRRAPRVAEVDATPVDPRGLMARLTRVTLDETATGAILRATGITPAQGYYDAELVGLPVDEKGVKTFEFRLADPQGTTQVGPEASRSVTVAIHLTHFQLQDLSGLRVVAAENAFDLRP